MLALVLSASITVVGGCTPVNGPTEIQKSVDELLTKIKNERRTHGKAWREWRLIMEIGEEAAPALMEVIRNSSDHELRLGALVVLGEWKYMPGFPLVEMCARTDQDSRLRAWALLVLERIDHDRAYAVIFQLASDPDAQVKQMIAKVLLKYSEHYQGRCAIFRLLLGDSHPQVRTEAGIGLLLARCHNADKLIQEALLHEKDDICRLRLRSMFEEVYGVPVKENE